MTNVKICKRSDGMFYKENGTTADSIFHANTREQNLKNLKAILALKFTDNAPAQQQEWLTKYKIQQEEQFNFLHPAEPGQTRGWRNYGPFWARQNEKDTPVLNRTSMYGGYVCGRLFKAGNLLCVENSATERWGVKSEKDAPEGYRDWSKEGFQITDQTITIPREGMQNIVLYKWEKSYE